MWFLLFMCYGAYAADMATTYNTDCAISIAPSQCSSLRSSDSPNRMDMYDGMMFYFFKGNGTEVRDHIKPYLQRKMQKAKRRSKLMELEQVPFDKLSTDELEITDQLKEYINKKVSKSLEEAFTEEHQIRLQYQQESQAKLTKNKVALITALTSLATAIITAGVTITVTMTT